MLTQGEAVFQAVVEVMGKKEDGAYNPNPEQLEVIRERVIARFLNGDTSHSKNPSHEQLRKYVPGLVNNWLRKDLRLNGGMPYIPKNPGSRSRHSIARPQVRPPQQQQPQPAPAPPDQSSLKAKAVLMEIDKRIAELRTLVAH